MVELGWEDRFVADSGWLREPWQVADPDPQSFSRFSAEGGVFSVPSPGCAMAWTRTTCPVWVGDFPYLEIEYEVSGTPNATSGLLLLSDGSTGPVTPGALNPENPLASGTQTRLGSATSGHHLVVFDLRDEFGSDRVARITILLENGDESSRLTLRRLAFWASDPSQEAQKTVSIQSDRTLFDFDDSSAAAVDGKWEPVQLPSHGRISAEWLDRAFGCETDWTTEAAVQMSGVPFVLSGSQDDALATSIQEEATIEVQGSWEGSELALLLGTRRFGSDRPWYSKGSPDSRQPLQSPHQTAIRLAYGDGTQRTFFPWSVARHSWVVDSTPQAYLVPLDPGKRLIRFSVEDKMDFGQVFLLAASVNASKPAFPTPSDEVTDRLIPSVQKVNAIPTRVERTDDRLVVENGGLRLSARIGSGLNVASLHLQSLDREILAGGRPTPLLRVENDKGNPLPLVLKHCSDSRSESKSVLDLQWSAPQSLTLHLQIVFSDTGEIRLAPSLSNAGEENRTVALACPNLENCRIAPDMEDSYYLLGTRSTVLSNAQTTVDEPYGGAYPLQFMDLHAHPHGGGLAIVVEDENLIPKRFCLNQSSEGTDLCIRFPEVVVAPGAKVVLPTVALHPHTGDWHAGFEFYREWVRSCMKSGAPARMQDLFYCRRDYPLGGTGYLFDVRKGGYEPDRLIDESQQSLGGIDMIDISGWAYNEQTGRVGDYRTNDLGGLAGLRRAIEESHARGIKVGLYFEGYLLDRRCVLAKRALPNWQLVGKDGKGKWWSGEMEFFTCPGVEPWREALSEMVADVAHETGADAVYLDQIGFSDSGKSCWSPDHGHPVPSNPMVEERRMIEAVRAKLDERTPGVAIYTEQIPCDGLIRYIDGAFNYGMSRPHSVRTDNHPTKLSLHRFVFPEIASIEMIGHGIRPIPVEVDDLHRCFFQGLPVWLKGRGDSWFSSQFRELSKRIHPILRNYEDLFRSPNCTPLIPTLRSGLYANRFDSESHEQTLITFYNARMSDLSGDLIALDLPEEAEIRPLLMDQPVKSRREGESTTLQGSIEPHSSAAILIVSPNR